MKGGIASKLAISFSLLVLVATATVGFLVFWGARQTITETSKGRLAHTAEIVEVRFRASLEAISNDVLFLASTPPVPGLVRALTRGPYVPDDGAWLDRRTNHTDIEWRDQLAEIFLASLQNRPSYLQVRYIGLADPSNRDACPTT